MSNEMAVKEIQAKFTADMSGFRKALEEAQKPAKDISNAIEQVGEAMRRASHLSDQEMQRMGRTLSSAGKQATQLGRQAQSLVTQEQSLSRSVDEQKTKLASLRTEYESTEGEIKRLSSVYDTIEQAAAGLDLSTPLVKQREQASAEMDRLEREILNLQMDIARVGDPNQGVLLPDNTVVSLEQARLRVVQLMEDADQAGDQFQRLDEAIKAIGEENLDFASKSGLKALQDQIGNAKGHLSQLELQAGQTQNSLIGYGENLETVRMRQQALAADTAELSNQVAGLGSLATPSLGERIGQAFSGLGQRISQVFSGVAATVKTALTNGLQLAGRGVTSFAGKLLGMAPGVSILKGIADRLRGVRSGGDGANLGLTKMVRSVRNLGVVALGLKAVKTIFGELRSVVTQYLSENQAAQNAVNSLKSAFANALAPAINIAINALNAILPYIQAVSNAFATLFTNLFGAQWTTISGGVSGAADAVDGVAGATKDATAAQEEYNRSLAGFDQITKLDNNSGSGGSGGSGGGGGTSTSTTDGGTGMLGQFSDFMTELAGLVKNGAWADLGAFLAESFGSAIDTLYGVLTSAETYAKIDSAVTALGATVNSFFARMTLIDEGTGDTIAEKTGMTLGAAVNLAFYTANSVLTSIDWDSIGLTIAQMINGAVEETDFGQIGTTVANYFLTLPKILYSSVVNTDWGAVGQGISDMVLSALTTVDDALREVEWDEIGHSVADFLLGINWVGIAGEIILVFADALGGLGMAVVTAIVDIGPKAVEAVRELGSKISDTFKLVGDTLSQLSLVDIVTGNVDWSSISSEFTLKLHAIWASDTDKSTAGTYQSLTDKGINVRAAASPSERYTSFNSTYQSLTDKGINVRAAASPSERYTSFNSTYQQMVKTPSLMITATAKGARESSFTTMKSAYDSITNKTRKTTLTGDRTSSFTNAKVAYDGILNKTRTVTLKGNPKASFTSAKRSYDSVKSKSVTASLKGNGKTLKLSQGWITSGLSSTKKAIGKALFGSAKWPKLYFAARGGIVDRATLLGGSLVAGEAGREAIIPLENHTEWIDKVADRVAQRIDGSNSAANTSQPLVLNFYVGEEKMVTKVIDGINDITRQTGACPIYV